MSSVFKHLFVYLEITDGSYDDPVCICVVVTATGLSLILLLVPQVPGVVVSLLSVLFCHGGVFPWILLLCSDSESRKASNEQCAVTVCVTNNHTPL